MVAEDKHEGASQRNPYRTGAGRIPDKPFRRQDFLDAIPQTIEIDCKNRAARNKLKSLKENYAGLLNKQIAAELGIREITVKERRAQVMRKMQTGSLSELVRMMQQLHDS